MYPEDDIFDALRAVTPLDPVRPALVAGDPERAMLAEREKKGIPVPKLVTDEIRTIAKECGAEVMI